MDNYNKNLYQRCRLCCSVIEIEKAFKENKNICKLCSKILEIQDIRDAISPKIYVFWKHNQQYRICTNIYRSFADSIFKQKILKANGVKFHKKLLVFI